MKQQLQRLWQDLQPVVNFFERRWKTIYIATAVTLFLLNLILFGMKYEWTGFGAEARAPEAEYVQVYEPSKDLWDWLQLLVVPSIIAFGAIWLNRQEKEREFAIQDQRAQDEALQSYIDQISHLLLEKNLQDVLPGDKLWSVARTRTAAIFPTLDPSRQVTVLRFLGDAGLVSRHKDIIALQRHRAIGAQLAASRLPDIDLSHGSLNRADLTGAVMTRAHLVGTRLRFTTLRRADLREAIMRQADLTGSVMIRASLVDADLTEAKLIRANLRGAQLDSVLLGGADLSETVLTGVSLSGASYDDGTKWPPGFDPQALGAIYKKSAPGAPHTGSLVAPPNWDE